VHQRVLPQRLIFLLEPISFERVFSSEMRSLMSLPFFLDLGLLNEAVFKEAIALSEKQNTP